VFGILREGAEAVPLRSSLLYRWLDTLVSEVSCFVFPLHLLPTWVFSVVGEYVGWDKEKEKEVD